MENRVSSRLLPPPQQALNVERSGGLQTATPWGLPRDGAGCGWRSGERHSGPPPLRGSFFLGFSGVGAEYQSFRVISGCGEQGSEIKVEGDLASRGYKASPKMTEASKVIRSMSGNFMGKKYHRIAELSGRCPPTGSRCEYRGFPNPF